MCGIVGVVVSHNATIDLARLVGMSEVIAHRGPDGSGHWISPSGHVGLGHRRLSIIDLSAEGLQPMASPSGRYHLTFNGEIYNFIELRRELEAHGIVFRGYSDTEVMAVGFDQWGIENTLRRMDGMFAIGVWDEQAQTLILARDRIGIKPLYYSHTDGELTFASELRPLVAWKRRLPPISATALTEYLRLGYVPAPLSIFEGINKLPQGSFMTFCHGQLSAPQQYWSLTDVMRNGMDNAFIDEADAITALDTQLRTSIASHMVSDVPIGAFLSGGVDSSAVVAIMQAQSVRPVKTFSIGFGEEAYNEAVYAKAVANHLGTDHHELYITDKDARAVIPYLADMYDEPFADSSQIPTFLVSKFAREHVTVSLSGDGGDELFAGYNRYVFVTRFSQNLMRFPMPIRQCIAQMLSAIKPTVWDAVFRYLNPLLPARLSPATPGEKMHKIARILSSTSLSDLHQRLISQWILPEHALAPHYQSAAASFDYMLSKTNDLPPILQQMLWDAQTYMVDDILTKVDRASMFIGLEARVPLLDHHVVELAYRIPLIMKLRDGAGKWALRQVLYRYVPRALIERPKMGFGVPMDDWLRGPLRDWAETYLAKERLCVENYFDVATIRQTWISHCNGSINCGGMLWTVLMFQLWLERTRSWI
jgi:asparagine synthase (glutamine-hydrolysing)